MINYYRSTRLAKMKKKKKNPNNTSIGKNVKKLEFSDPAGGNVK